MEQAGKEKIFGRGDKYEHPQKIEKFEQGVCGREYERAPITERDCESDSSRFQKLGWHESDEDERQPLETDSACHQPAPSTSNNDWQTQDEAETNLNFSYGPETSSHHASDRRKQWREN